MLYIATCSSTHCILLKNVTIFFFVSFICSISAHNVSHTLHTLPVFHFSSILLNKFQIMSNCMYWKIMVALSFEPLWSVFARLSVSVCFSFSNIFNNNNIFPFQDGVQRLLNIPWIFCKMVFKHSNKHTTLGVRHRKREKKKMKNAKKKKISFRNLWLLFRNDHIRPNGSGLLATNIFTLKCSGVHFGFFFYSAVLYVTMWL